MQFGVQFFPCARPAEKDAAAYFRESLAIAEEAESLGFTHARIVEHYFHRYGGFSPNPLIYLAALSQRTKAMRLVTGAVLPVFNHPLKLAGEIGMLDAISGGRLDVGVARAFLQHEFRRFGVDLDESQARFKEGVEQLDLLLTQEDVTHRGRFHIIERTTSLPRPTQKPRPKFYVAATQSPETFEYAGRNGHSLMAIPIGSKLEELISIYRTAWREAGHPGDGEVMVAFHMFCHEDAKIARDIARTPVADYFEALEEVTRDWAVGGSTKDYRGYRESMSKLRSVSLETQIESGGCWVGSPSEIRTIIHDVCDRIGPFEHASLQINFSSLALREAQHSMRLFAQHVMPHFVRQGAQQVA